MLHNSWLLILTSLYSTMAPEKGVNNFLKKARYNAQTQLVVLLAVSRLEPIRQNLFEHELAAVKCLSPAHITWQDVRPGTSFPVDHDTLMRLATGAKISGPTDAPDGDAMEIDSVSGTRYETCDPQSRKTYLTRGGR
jgi:hypothetical protein